MSEYLVEVKDLKQYFPIKGRFYKNDSLKAVDGVSFSIKPGETLGLVGESGCGKTTVGRSLLRLYTPTGGEVLYNGEKVDGSSIKHMRKEMQMVFQDPYSSLNPRMTVEDIIGEPLDVHKMYSNKAERREKIINLMELVGTERGACNPLCPRVFRRSETAYRYRESAGDQSEVHRLRRGGQRVGRFHSGAVINMFEELQEKLGVAYLFIAHDLLVVHHISDRIAVMYLGRIVEIADSNELNDNPLHPYTQSLLSAVPIRIPRWRRKDRESCWRAMFPAPCICPAAARSVPAAVMRRRSAHRSVRP